MRIRLALLLRDGGRSQSGLVDSWAGGRRVIVASFVSHIHHQQLADAAVENDRVLVMLGLSMRRNVKLARDVGILRIPDWALRDIEDLDELDPEKTLIVCTGSQGEPRAALTQMAIGQASGSSSTTTRWSSVPDPGNEAAVASVRNGLARHGVRVFHSGMVDLHTSTRQATGTEDAPLGCGAGVVRAGAASTRIWSPTEISPAHGNAGRSSGLLRRRRSDRAR